MYNAKKNVMKLFKEVRFKMEISGNHKNSVLSRHHFYSDK